MNILIKNIKVLKKSENSMNLKFFAERINSLSEIENYEKKDNVTVEQARFTVKKNDMILETVQKKTLT